MLLAGLLPANIYAALHGVPLRGNDPTPLVFRIPLQLFWMGLLRNVTLLARWTTKWQHLANCAVPTATPISLRNEHMNQHRTAIRLASLIVFGVACGCTSETNPTSTGGVGGAGNGQPFAGTGGSSIEQGGSGASGSASGGSGASGSASGSASGGSSGMTSGAGNTAGDAGMAGSAGSDSGALPDLSKKFIGNISTRNNVRPDFAMYWRQFTPENEGKWGNVQRSQDTFNWAPLDAEYQYARENNLIFKQHTFVWGGMQPSWLANLSAADATAAVQKWMQSFCERYPAVQLIDVVNEPPPHTTPSYMNLIGGAGSSGYDWIVNAFNWARAACPNAILILNDYGNIEDQGSHDHFIAIVKAVKDAGAPIDAVGAQAHSAHQLQTSTVKGFIDSLASETGLPVYITEYDIDLADDNQQMQIMQSQVTMFWENPNVKGITLWGYILGSTWQRNSGIIRSDGTLRPAMTWLVDFMKSH